jgi:hypothetical protein
LIPAFKSIQICAFAREWLMALKLLVSREIAMHITKPILLGAFLLSGPLPDAGAQTAPPDTDTRPALNTASASLRDGYIQKSEAELDDWQAKLVQFDDETKARVQQDAAAARADLMAAMDKAETGAWKMQTVAADGLENAKISYEKATSELADTWEKMQPDDRH